MYEFVNVTLKQFFRYESYEMNHDEITILLSLFKDGIWEPKDEIVHGRNLLCDIKGDFNMCGDVIHNVYYNKELFFPAIV